MKGSKIILKMRKKRTIKSPLCSFSPNRHHSSELWWLAGGYEERLPEPEKTVIFSHVSVHFLIPLSASSVICTVRAQWLVILDTIIVIRPSFSILTFKCFRAVYCTIISTHKGLWSVSSYTCVHLCSRTCCLDLFDFCLCVLHIFSFIHGQFVRWLMFCASSLFVLLDLMSRVCFQFTTINNIRLHYTIDCNNARVLYVIGEWVQVLSWSVVDSTWAATYDNSTYQWNSESWCLQLRYRPAGDHIQGPALLLRYSGSEMYNYMFLPSPSYRHWRFSAII